VPVAITVALACAYAGCSDKPAPPEVALARAQEQHLRGAGASNYAPAGYQGYLDELEAANRLWRQQQQKLALLRDNAVVSATFSQLLRRGEALADQIQEAQRSAGSELVRHSQQLRNRLSTLRALSEALRDRRLASRRLVRIDIRLGEADRLLAAGNLQDARRRLEEAAEEVQTVVATQQPLLARFTLPSEIDRWRRWRDEAIATSRASGEGLIVVSKIERRLVLYRGGKEVARYDVGLGGHPLTDKLHSGDKATPEGSYRIERKNPSSRYGKALLIDYPNDADRRRYQAARREGVVAAGIGIGGLIEIHGGGSDGLTDGCVALDNRNMETLYARVTVGTPVLIVGTTEHDNLVSAALRQLN